jgi:hypothetical protein
MILLKSTYRVDYDRSSGERDEGWNLLVSVYDAPGIVAAVCAVTGEVKARIDMYDIECNLYFQDLYKHCKHGMVPAWGLLERSILLICVYR